MLDDDIFDALSESRRRQLLLDLSEREPRRVSELSGGTEDLARAHETFIDEFLSGSKELPDVDRDRLETHHVHLPKLADYGFVDWDREANLVRRGWRFEELAPVLELLARYEAEQPVELTR